jgi:hypothetical protein
MRERREGRGVAAWEIEGEVERGAKRDWTRDKGGGK